MKRRKKLITGLRLRRGKCNGLPYRGQAALRHPEDGSFQPQAGCLIPPLGKVLFYLAFRRVRQSANLSYPCLCILPGPIIGSRITPQSYKVQKTGAMPASVIIGYFLLEVKSKKRGGGFGFKLGGILDSLARNQQRPPPGKPSKQCSGRQVDDWSFFVSLLGRGK